ncbi:MAG: hypothetical protein KF819_26060 [Labilithrix sp.]|nr:hypothetical protein [Labilithrix sp.]
MSDEAEAAPTSRPPESERMRRLRRNVVFHRLAGLGASAQAAIPGLYAWAITVAPAAWSRGAPVLAKVAAIVGVVALATAPLVEGAGLRARPAEAPDDPSRPAEAAAAPPPTGLRSFRAWTGPTWARVWSVWGFVLSSAIVWALAPGALSSIRLDGVRGALGVVGWGLFAFASAGPSLRADPDAAKRIVAGSALKPRSALPRGDGVYVAGGVVLALAMQAVGWSVAVPERAVLVRLVTVACGVAVISATTSIALARHATRTPAARSLKLRRALPWMVLLALFLSTGLVLLMPR